MPSQIVVHYGEVGTKGDNRVFFESCLAKNIRQSLAPIGRAAGVRKLNQRFLVTVEEDDVPEAMDRLARVFGVAWFAPVEMAPLEYSAILEKATALLGGSGRGAEGERPDTFRVSVRRANKSFEMGSQDMARRLGDDLIGALGLRVNLSSPDTELFVDVISDRALLHVKRVKGLGGLPVGATGRVLHMLSGGIDSPASAWLMMKRGCTPVYLHFYIAPTPQAVVESKLADLVRSLASYGGGRRMILVPFAPYQLATRELPEEFEPTVFRYFMRLVAERLAEEMDFLAISTGDNLAQVASQTLYNISCIDRCCSIPTLRPLLGYDKDEIVQLAKRIGTYEISLREYKDCCSIISRHPKTRMRWESVEEAARRFRFADLVSQCTSMGSVVTYGSSSESPALLEPLSSLITRYERKKASVQLVGRPSNKDL